MARTESDREDLIREATALTERAEFRRGGGGPLITAGFRRDGSLAIYFDQDPVYQFDTGGRLRRAFVDGFLYRSQHSGLARLQRERTPDATHLLRHDLTPEECGDFRRALRARLRQLATDLQTGSVSTVRAVVDDEGAFRSRLEAAVAGVLSCDADWLSPHIRARK